MNAYDKPLIYTLSHVLLGAAAVYYRPLLWLFLIYQVAQLILNVRVFGFHGEIRAGNNPVHTARKIAEFGLGYAAAYLISVGSNK